MVVLSTVKKRSLLSLLTVLENEMHRLNKKDNSYIIAAAILITLGIITESTMAAPATATTTTTTTTNTTNSNATMTTTTSTSSSSGIELSAQPIWQEWATTVNITPINQTLMIATYTLEMAH